MLAALERVCFVQSKKETKTDTSKHAKSKEVFPISKVCLSKNGVAYFERTGQVLGNQTVELFFRTSEMNDILKSLTMVRLGCLQSRRLTFVADRHERGRAGVVGELRIDQADRGAAARHLPQAGRQEHAAGPPLAGVRVARHPCRQSSLTMPISQLKGTDLELELRPAQHQQGPGQPPVVQRGMLIGLEMGRGQTLINLLGQ